MLPSLLRRLFFALFAVSAFGETPAQEAREYLPPAYESYFTARLAAQHAGPDWLAEVTPENWPQKKAEMRRELQNMLGLDPWPARTDLQPVITGTVKGEGYRVEKVEFQSRPGLYVTGDLYLPDDTSHPLPTILYVCGHSKVVENKVSMGNKTGYQHHGEWYARHGYVCFVIDTIQLGEITGEHAGTHHLGRWWWVSRGYTPAGVEAWNAMRALDYLETRPEVDKTRFGITGRSGGGAYSWYTAALDERIVAAAPTAGITSMKNHILDGCIEGHCDCMFMVNSFGWDFDKLAALVAPRPLLVANTDKDTIFPLDGVMGIYNHTRKLYEKLGQVGNIGLQIAEGPHADVQPLNTGEMHWMDRFLQGARPTDVTDEPMTKRLQPAELKVFAKLPVDEKVTTADEWFVPEFKASAPPADAAGWAAQRQAWMDALTQECFRTWPAAKPNATLGKPVIKVAEGLRLTQAEVNGAGGFPLTLWTVQRDDLSSDEVELTVLNVMDDDSWAEFTKLRDALFAGAKPAEGADEFVSERRMFQEQNWVMAYVAPRGVGPTSLAALPEKKRTGILRRFQLLGETLESGQVWDIGQVATALNARTLWLQAEGPMAGNALYASLFLPKVARLDLHNLPASHAQGPTYINVLRHLDLPQAVALAAERTPINLYTSNEDLYSYATTLMTNLHWPKKQLEFRQEIPTEQ